MSKPIKSLFVYFFSIMCLIFYLIGQTKAFSPSHDPPADLLACSQLPKIERHICLDMYFCMSVRLISTSLGAVKRENGICNFKCGTVMIIQLTNIFHFYAQTCCCGFRRLFRLALQPLWIFVNKIFRYRLDKGHHIYTV